MGNTIAPIRKLVENNKIKEAIEQLGELTSDKGLINELTLLSSRLTEVKKTERRGIADSRDLAIEKNRIRGALLDILDEINEDDLNISQEKKSTNTTINIYNDGAKIGQQNIDSEVNNNQSNFNVG